jgi:hypothetical protein
MVCFGLAHATELSERDEAARQPESCSDAEATVPARAQKLAELL